MKTHVPSLLLLPILLLAAHARAEPQTHYHASPGNGNLPFSEAVQVGDMLYLSGKLGVDPKTGKLAEGGISGETRQIMKSIQAALDRYGSSIQQVVKCTVYLADIKEWAEMNEVYRTFFPRNPPARSAVEVSALGLGARVEIECMATMK
jgi:2-iminobutanoate/2-iminopropanoate deaminase